MVKYKRGESPLCLVDSKRQEAFDEDCTNREYVDSNSLYKCKYKKDNEEFFPVRDALKKIYYNKCAYCETKFNRSYIKIEHYRPKKSNYYVNSEDGNNHRLYYFLSYSWSNLLPICDKCNTKKSNNFGLEDESKRIVYDGRDLKELQYVTKEYNEIEKPLFIHPEYDDYEHLFRFNKYGEIKVFGKFPDANRMTYTIKNSYLDERDLVNRRAKVLKDFVNIKNELYHLFKVALKTKDKNDFEYFKKSSNEKVKEFFNLEEEFLSVRKFIIKRLKFFLIGTHNYFRKFIEGFIVRYTSNIYSYSC